VTPATPPSATGAKIASGVPAIPDAYTTAPATYKAVATVPGSGGKVTLYSILFSAPPAPHDGLSGRFRSRLMASPEF
jgi:hypothetical protein